MRAHIVSHSHWDREWYESFEQHRMKLIELIDDLIELFDKDSDFKAFHLDGQTIVLNDYLAIKPERKAKLQQLVADGRLIIGPYYILQDELLLTGEENIRNGLVAKQYEAEWGEYLTPVGYFPDTFGHVGQLAQLCAKMGLNYAFFGRGVKPIGFDNQVLEDENFTSRYSEMWLEAPDGSRVLGILFANWYCNGNQIPVDRLEAKVYWDKRLADAKRYASTDSLLFMNGCDHQPVQKNLSQALKVANELYPEIEFIHSTLADYAEEVVKQLPEDLAVIQGEMTSQETDGWYTLANTASSRVYLKQANARLADKLTMVAEPLSTLVSGYHDYKGEQLDYAWKLLLENLPHDSICGCSIDQVHQEMVTRFNKVESVVDYVIDEAALALYQRIALDQLVTSLPVGAIPLVVINPAPNPKEEVISQEYPLIKHYFSDSSLMPDALYREVDSQSPVQYQLYDTDGQPVVAKVTYQSTDFGYDSPKGSFRRPYIGRTYRIDFWLEQPALSWQVFYLLPVTDVQLVEKPLPEKPSHFSNPFFSLDLVEGRLVYQSADGQIKVDDLLCFEDTGDIGNQYIYKAPVDDRPIFSQLTKAVFDCHQPADGQAWRLTYELIIPQCADQRLLEEEKSLVEFRQRQAGRSDRLSRLQIDVCLTMYRLSSAVSCQVIVDNKQINHRLRLLVNTGLHKADTHFADSSFEVINRDNRVTKEWQNPNNPQHMLKFVGLEEESGGMLVSSTGLNEYEIVSHETGWQIGLTLLRSIDELGDWGFFPTEGSLALGENRWTMMIDSFVPDNKIDLLKRRWMMGVVSPSAVLVNNDVRLLEKKAFNNQPIFKPEVKDLPQNSMIFYTALKKSQAEDYFVVRYFNFGNQLLNFSVRPMPKYMNFIEEPIKEDEQLTGGSVRTEVLE